MESSLLNGMCRCCASEGVFKDVKTAYTWMGEEEVYADMLKQCFDICLSTSEQGDDGGICEVCITQLRNAANFKKQVLTTEEQFKKHALSKLFKPSIIKLEVSPEDDNDSDDNALSGDDGYSGPEFEVPIKTEVDDPKPKKRAAASKASTSRAKKAKADNGETSTKRPRKKKAEPKKMEVITLKPNVTIKQRKRTKRTGMIALKEPGSEQMKWTPICELDKHKDNVRTIISNSNATPIGRYGGIGYGCWFCSEQFVTPAELKIHTISKHQNDKSTYMENVTMITYIVKLDITGLKCDLCQMDIDTVLTLVEHLQRVHDSYFHTDINDHILPFKFDTGPLLKCVICENDFNNFKVLLEHMNIHYSNYMCSVCGSGFVCKRILQAHAARHKTGVFNCHYCDKQFNNAVKKRDHERGVHVTCSMRSKCGYCGEKFSDYTKKNNHEVKVHGAKPVVLKCQACDKVFDNQRALTVHTKTYHMMQKRTSSK
ncbi:uncharacterized protein LOC142985169 isoform X12 [Anticarsia gemmatalis]|uniref:uncharacterized protein LOC142985169 isoform X12 n=1 Tax=Anticarsia gemmatalis TaxID=129554 RepID=UPI003F768C1F